MFMWSCIPRMFGEGHHFETVPFSILLCASRTRHQRQHDRHYRNSALPWSRSDVHPQVVQIALTPSISFHLSEALFRLYTQFSHPIFLLHKAKKVSVSQGLRASPVLYQLGLSSAWRGLAIRIETGVTVSGGNSSLYATSGDYSAPDSRETMPQRQLAEAHYQRHCNWKEGWVVAHIVTVEDRTRVTQK